MHPEKTDASIATLRLAGRFDFHSFKSFQGQYEPALADDKVRTIDVNMATVSYIDSSALGMLMLLREKAEPLGKTVRIVHCTGLPRDIMDMANFHKRFEFLP